MSTLESINAQIKEHEEKIQALKNERNALKLMKLCDITDDDLDRVGNFQVDLKYETYSNEEDEYSNDINGKMIIKYNYTNIHFKTPTEFETNICTVKLEATYSYHQSYQNRYEPNIVYTSKVDVRGNVGEWEYIDDQCIQYSEKDGKWAEIINKILKHIDEEETGEDVARNWREMMEFINDE